MLLTIILKALIALAVLVTGFVFGLLVIGKRADEAISRALDEYTETKTCTRQEPHVCKDNGPCNGWPKPTSQHFNDWMKGWEEKAQAEKEGKSMLL